MLPLRVFSQAACFLLASALQPSALADTGGQIATALRFTNTGMKVTLASCELPKTCMRQPPTLATKKTRETGNDSVVDQRHLVFDGLEIEFLYVLSASGSPPQSLAQAYRTPYILELAVTKPQWPIGEGLRIGMSRSEVEKALGQAGPRDLDCATYTDTGTQNEVTLCYAHDRLASVKWVLEWDG
jgi:hypothetical protein